MKYEKRKRPLAIFIAMGMLTIGAIGFSAWTVSAVPSLLQIRIDQREPFFSPGVVTATAGTVIEWQNRTGEPHTIRADDCLSRRRCSFDSGMIMPNGKFTVDYLQPGEYAYHCGIHPFMRGMLMVRPLIPNVRSESI